jgi:hypothetical protein
MYPEGHGAFFISETVCIFVRKKIDDYGRAFYVLRIDYFDVLW